MFLFLGRRDVSRGERDGHRDGFSSKSKSRFRVSVALQKRSHARPASIAAGTVCERKQQRRASSLGRRAARGVPREVPRRRRAPPAGARPDGRAARAETRRGTSRAPRRDDPRDRPLSTVRATRFSKNHARGTSRRWSFVPPSRLSTHLQQRHRLLHLRLFLALALEHRGTFGESSAGGALGRSRE